MASSLLVLVAAGCHASADAGGSTITPSVDAGLTDARQSAMTGRYIPLSVGARWTWNAFDSRTGASGVATSIVDSLDSLTGSKAGIQAFRVRNATLSGSTINWQQDTGTAIIRQREQFFDATGALMTDHLYTPGKMRLDESAPHTAGNAMWTETFTDNVTSSAASTTTVTVAWTVVAVDEQVAVPAGTFACLHVHSVESGAAGYDSHFWYARNVGKVKETGTEVRELVGYSIP